MDSSRFGPFPTQQEGERRESIIARRRPGLYPLFHWIIAPRKAFGLLLVVLVGLPACADLSSVRNYAKTSQENIAKRFPAAASIAYRACIGQKRREQIEDRTTGDVFAECENYKESLTKTNDVLVAYLKSLQELASNNRFTTSDEPAKDDGQIEKPSVLTSEEQTTVIRLKEVFSKETFADAWTQPLGVEKAISKANLPVRGVCEILGGQTLWYINNAFVFDYGQRTVDSLGELPLSEQEGRQGVKGLHDTIKNVIEADKRQSVVGFSMLKEDLDAIDELERTYEKIANDHSDLCTALEKMRAGF